MNNNLFKIDDSEKMRILEMHQSATNRHYLGEQVAPATTTTAAAPATAPGPKDPKAFVVNDIPSIVIGEQTWKFQKVNTIFDENSQFSPITLTATASINPPIKNPSTGVMSSSYKIKLTDPENKIMITFSYNCGGEYAVYGSTLVSADNKIKVRNPVTGKEYLKKDEIQTIITQAFAASKRVLLPTKNTFLNTFSQQYCKS